MADEITNPEWESTLNGEETPSEYYENGTIRKINEGMNGLEAATLIYDNDTLLHTKLKNLENRYNEYKAYAETLQGGGRIEIPIEHEVGNGTNVVMSQSAVTHVTDLLQEQLNDAVYGMTRVPEAPVMLDPVDPEHREHCDVAEMAATDLSGHSLTKMYYDIEDLKLLVASLSYKMNSIADFLSKIGYIIPEEPVDDETNP
jgi:hypothetical protein